MILSNIRKATTEEELKQATKDLVQNWHRLTLGETQAMLTEIRNRAEKLGIDIKVLNKYADDCAS